MTTAPAKANPKLAFIKCWGIVTASIAVATRFCIIFGFKTRDKRNKKEDDHSTINVFNTSFIQNMVQGASK